MYLAPASVVWMVLFAAIFEWPGLLQSSALGIVAENPGLFMAAATMGFGVMLLSFFTIQLCGSLTLKVRRMLVMSHSCAQRVVARWSGVRASVTSCCSAQRALAPLAHLVGQRARLAQASLTYGHV